MRLLPLWQRGSQDRFPTRDEVLATADGQSVPADYESAPAVHCVSMGVYTRRLQASVDG